MMISKGTLNKLVTQPTPVPLHPAKLSYTKSHSTEPEAPW